MDGDRPRQPANRNCCYRLLHVSWALAQFFVLLTERLNDWVIRCDAGTLVETAQDNTMIVKSEVDTLIESNLGTMIINDTDEDDNNEDSTAADDSDTMKR